MKICTTNSNADSRIPVWKGLLFLMPAVMGVALVACSHMPQEAQKESNRKSHSSQTLISDTAISDTDLKPADNAPGAALVPTDDFRMTRREETYETFVDIKPKNEEKPSIDWRSTSTQLFISWHRTQPLSVQTELLRAMIQKLATVEDLRLLRNASVHIPLDIISCPEFVKRLAETAAADREWRVYSGMLHKRTESEWSLRLHRYIVHIAESQHLFGELDTIFAPLGVLPHLEGVEKCSIVRSRRGHELGGKLYESGIRSPNPLPAGCLMSWFRLAPLADDAKSDSGQPFQIE